MSMMRQNDGPPVVKGSCLKKSARHNWLVKLDTAQANPTRFHINRRAFLKSTAAATAMAALPDWGADAADLVNGKPKRVGLIGAGWYGKSDLWRLVQVAPVEIVAVCDPDKQMLAGAVKIASERQKSKKAPRTYNDYREMLKEKDLDIVLVGSPDHWHALHTIAA